MVLYVLIDVSSHVKVIMPLKQMFVGEFIFTLFVSSSNFYFHTQDEN
jgi:hypothetical protein